ncbi:MAG: hypothetical protein IJP29_08380 [Lachnospiraceae bacterium]|nr:hypothetical protein [Lachnospiraceae bacterium]
MDKGFPDKVEQYKIKWYVGPGNYGAFFSKKVTYLAISAGNQEQATFLLFLSDTLEVLTVLECESEQDAFDTVELPENVAWTRIYQSVQQKKQNRMYVWRKLRNVLRHSNPVIYFVAVVIFAVSGWFPRYGNFVLLFRVLRDVSMLVVGGLFLRFAYLGCKTYKKGSKFEFLVTRIFFLIVSLAVMYIGMDTLLIGIDTCIGTKDIYLTSTSYYREDVSKGLPDLDCVSGEYEGKLYDLAVTGCNRSLLYEIEDTHPMVRVTLYEKSKSVVELEIVDNIEE